MTPWQSRTTVLTKRMADDMKLRNFAQATIDAYTYHVGRFAEFLGKSPEQASAEDVRSFHKGSALERLAWSAEQHWHVVCAESLPLVAVPFSELHELGADSVVGRFGFRRHRLPGLPASAGKKFPG